MSENTWMPIETAPKDGTPFLAWDSDEAVRAYVSANDDGTNCLAYFETGEVDDLWHGLPSGVTHWMPLPAAPAHTPSIEQASS